MSKILLVAVILSLILFSGGLSAAKLTSLAELPRWEELDAYQYSMTRSEFIASLKNVYSPYDEYRKSIRIFKDCALIMKQFNEDDFYKLSFKKEGDATMLMMRYWRDHSQWEKYNFGKNLTGLRIAIDPGHIGGQYAQMEERSFKVNEIDRSVAEGDLTLEVGRTLKEVLEKEGAQVTLVRENDYPRTSMTPESLIETARSILIEKRNGEEEVSEAEIRSYSELLFYRVAEINARAEYINNVIQPDFVLCLHFNAAPWPDKSRKILAKDNHFHALINGAYSESELEFDDMRFSMLLRILQRTHSEEAKICESVVEAMKLENELPPFRYAGKSGVNINGNPYIWGRNLLANRKYACPVIYLEPYCMNNEIVYERIQEGDYEGVRDVAGKQCKSIFREYADGVVKGLLNYYIEKKINP